MRSSLVYTPALKILLILLYLKYIMKLKDFGIIIRTIGIIYLFILLIDNRVTVPLSIVVLVTVGYLCSAISCTAKLFSPSMKHHKIVNYFIALLGIIIIIKHYSDL
jgi:hypothetical protein